MSWRLNCGFILLFGAAYAASPAGLPAGLAALPRADVDSALPLLDQAALVQNTQASAHLALGRLYQAVFNRPKALQHLSAAFAAAPADAEVVSAYAAATPNRVLELALLRRLQQLDMDDVACRRRIRWLERLGDRAVNRLETPYENYTIRMPVAYSRENRAVGWVLAVRLNRSRPLRLLLDTGARGILISLVAARKADLERLAETALGGFGDDSARTGQVLLAQSMQVGELGFSNVIVEASSHASFPADLDGLIGLDVFRHFLITLDGKSSRLRLSPLEGAGTRDGEGERPWGLHEPAPRPGRTLLQSKHLLVVPVHLESKAAARFALDSGAAYSLLQRNGPSELSLRQVSLQGLSGLTSAGEVLRTVRLELPGGRNTVLYEAVHADLAAVSNAFGMKLDGLLGFPVLRRLVTTIDLRSGSFDAR